MWESESIQLTNVAEWRQLLSDWKSSSKILILL